MRYSLFILLFFLFCQSLPNSIGRTREIMIVTESHQVFDSLSLAIQITYHTPRTEQKFKFIEAGVAKLSKILNFHIIILADPLDKSEVGLAISDLLSPDAEGFVQKQGFGVFQTENQWAKDQTIIIIAATNDSNLIGGISQNKFRIRQLVNDHFYKRIAHETFGIGEDKKLEDYLVKTYHYQIKIPEGYHLEEKYQKDNFIYFHRHNPDRSIFITRVKRKDAITIDWLLDQRDLITLLYYEKDYAYRDLCFGGWTKLNGRRVFKIYGVWQNDSIGAGGPFVMVCYPNKDYCYLVDGMVFVPGKEKITYLTSIEAIVSSFVSLDTHTPSAKIYKLSEVYRG